MEITGQKYNGPIIKCSRRQACCAIYTAEQVCLVGQSGVDGCVDGARSVVVDSASADRVAVTVKSVLCQPPQLTVLEHVHTSVVH